MIKRNFLTYVTECGIPGIGEIPFGIHMCHFYPQRQHLIDGLVPYFKAGLSNNERCLWITAPPLPADEAKAELQKAVPGLQALLENGQMRIIDAEDWYESAEDMDANDMIDYWLREEEQALEDGCEGLRIAGNAGFVTPEHWDKFMEYESNAGRAFQGRRIVALCSYNSHHCQPTGVLEVIRTHDHTLDRQDMAWEVLRGPRPRINDSEFSLTGGTSPPPPMRDEWGSA